jgi:hypothetical protein
MKSEKEHKELVEKLQAMGYKEYTPHNNADKTWWKSFLREENVWEDDRSCYQICWSIYDFHKFIADRAPDLKDTPYGYGVCVMVSRTVNERADLQLNATYSVEEVEGLGASFYQWVKENIKIEKL